MISAGVSFSKGVQYIRYIFRCGINLVIRFMYILEVMGVRTAYHTAGFKVWMLFSEPVQIFKVMKLGACKRTVRRDESEIGNNACGRFVHMGGIGYTAEGFHKRENIVKGDGNSRL